MNLKNTITKVSLFLFFFLTYISNVNSQISNIDFKTNSAAEYKVIISFTGDVLVHKDLYEHAVASGKNNFSILWNKINPLLEKADFSYANLEGPTALGISNKLKDLGDIGFKYDGVIYSGTNFLFNYHPEIINDLKASGFDIVSTANNHTFDRGSVGIDKTIDAMIERKMHFVGTRKKDSKDKLYKITEIKNFKIAWISCTEMLNGFKDKYDQTTLCYEQGSKIIEMIKEIKTNKLADLIFVLPHWGSEYIHEANSEQKKYAKLYAEAGADVIIGSHPHVLQPVEKYITKDQRQVFIAYSLGNFLAYQRDIDRKSSAIVYLEFSKDASKSWISNYTYQPTIRDNKEIFPAANRPEVVQHVEKYLGKFNP